MNEDYNITSWLKEQEKKEKAEIGIRIAWGVFILAYVIIGIMILKLL